MMARAPNKYTVVLQRASGETEVRTCHVALDAGDLCADYIMDRQDIDGRLPEHYVLRDGTGVTWLWLHDRTTLWCLFPL